MELIENTIESYETTANFDGFEVSESPELRVEGFVSVEDVADEIEEMFFYGLEKGASTNWESLDEFYTVARKQWTVITGTPGTGKSLFMDNLQINLATKHGWRFLDFSAETQPVKLHIKSLAEIKLNKRFTKQNVSMQEYAHTLAFIQDHFRFADLEESEWTVVGLLEKADAMREQGFKFDGLVIDPYNELEHRRPSAMSETEYVSMVLSKLRRYARKHDIHLWLVAHPKKLQKIQQKFDSTEDADKVTKQVYPVPTLYDISGSAHFYNKADMGIVLWRDKSIPENPTRVIVEKVKFRHCGKTGETNLWFDTHTTKFHEFYYDCTQVKFARGEKQNVIE